MQYEEFCKHPSLPIDVSKDGKEIRSVTTHKRLTFQVRGNYYRVRVLHKTYSVHRLVFESWNKTQIPVGQHIDHINGDSFSNHIENLKQVSPKEHRHKSNKSLFLKREKITQTPTWISCFDFYQEIWKQHSKTIWISSIGRVKTNINKEPFWGFSFGASEYLMVGKSFVHQLVARNFLQVKLKYQSNSDDLVVNHLNRNKLDNRVSNLEYTSNTENVRHACAYTWIAIDTIHNSISSFPCRKKLREFIREHGQLPSQFIVQSLGKRSRTN